MSPATSSRRIGRACDECRARKVKFLECDVSAPQCSNCRISELQCTYTSPVKKRGPRFRNPQQEVIPSITASESWSASSGSEVFMFQESVLTPTSHTDTLGLDPAEPQSAPSGGFTVIRQQLLFNLRHLRPEITLKHLISQCLDSFMQFSFAQAPIIHEPTLRANISLLDPDLQWPSTNSVSSLAAASHKKDTESHDLIRARSFVLLTAVCAFSIAHSPAPVTPGESKLSNAFLEASRKMLALYHDEDVGNPDSSSVIFRMLHSAAIHSVAETRLSWFVLGEAIRLVQDMQLHTETSLIGLDPLEAQLRRNVCCLLYTADRSAAILNNRPVTLGELSLEPPNSPSHRTWDDTPLMDGNKPYNTRQFEHCIATGFGMCQDVWSSASNLLLELRLVERRFAQHSNDGLPDSHVSIITKAYLEFMSVLDDAPSWFNNPDIGASQEPATLTEEVIRYQSRCFWVQHMNIQVTFHCLRLIILQKSADCNLSSLLGVSDQPLMLAFKKTEIAQDMLRMIQSAPFEALKINGEPCVEKIRQVGASLLEIAQNIEVPQIAARARADFSTLLDILTRLDSSVSNTLCLT